VRLGDPSMIKGQKARIFEREHGIARHEAIRQGNRVLTIAWIGNLVEGLANGSIECIGIEMLAHRRLEKLLTFRFVLSLELSPGHGGITYTTQATVSSPECTPRENRLVGIGGWGI